MAPRLEISEDEIFPVYQVQERDEPSHFDPEVTLTDEEYAEYTRVCDEYDAWQERLKALRAEAKRAASSGRHDQDRDS